MSSTWHHATAMRVHEHGHPVCSPYRHAVHREGPSHATRHKHGRHWMLLPHVGQLVSLVVTWRGAVRGAGG